VNVACAALRASVRLAGCSQGSLVRVLMCVSDCTRTDWYRNISAGGNEGLFSGMSLALLGLAERLDKSNCVLKREEPIVLSSRQ